MRDREMFEEKGNITHHQQFVSKSHSLCVILLIKNQNITQKINHADIYSRKIEKEKEL